jgi:hypothetical protein
LTSTWGTPKKNLVDKKTIFSVLLLYIGHHIRYLL